MAHPARQIPDDTRDPVTLWLLGQLRMRRAHLRAARMVGEIRSEESCSETEAVRATAERLCRSQRWVWAALRRVRTW